MDSKLLEQVELSYNVPLSLSLIMGPLIQDAQGEIFLAKVLSSQY